MGGDDKTKPDGGDKTKPDGDDKTKPDGDSKTKPDGGDKTKPDGGDKTKPDGDDKTKPDGSDKTKPDKYGKSGGGGLRIRSPNAAILMGDDVKLFRSGAESLAVAADVTVAGELHAESITVAGTDLQKLIENALKEALESKKN